ncbi:glyceraldehyde-3-phosphate dehydrogenase [Frondihabitans australicus]|uniref:Glyceraldehyde 3-phosphate dehydrogenase n=1 Tax=Frondihabitans australicus TaxID=386892 RepID=A0A495IDL4_9MICO|nr:glyceraldehyde-3-phosphate dehydrogenase [Frondihabitans australicus]RKR73411.1 glyceraldehyde 3-phosphate dehydrogenase [Frondihabitans australicus]
MAARDELDDTLELAWSDRLAAAESMIPIIGRLHRESGVVVSLHGQPLLGQSPIGIVKAHRFTRRVEETEVPLVETLAVLTELARADLGPASVDVAELAQRFRQEGGGTTLADYLRDEFFLAGRPAAAAVEAAAAASSPSSKQDVVLYGFGRIGRMLARILIERAGAGSTLALRAVVVKRRGEHDIVKRASLLRRDSIHGPFEGTITVDEANDVIIANGTRIQFLYSDSPAEVDYAAHAIHDAIVVDNTGRWRDRAGLSQHLQSSGASRVILTAPGKGDVPNVVHGINHELASGETIVSAASCTTNAIVPVLQVMSDRFGIRHGHVETVHSFTNDQNLVDNFHSGDRRGRAAGLNMVITETGAAKAAEKALPELAGRLTANAVRVPTPNVSLAILHLSLETVVSRDDVNAVLRESSLSGPLRRQIDYIESPEVVSTDFRGSRRAGVVDGLATIGTGDGHVVLYVWYDNESGYSRQVVRVLREMVGGDSVTIPAPRATALKEGVTA